MQLGLPGMTVYAGLGVIMAFSAARQQWFRVRAVRLA